MWRGYCLHCGQYVPVYSRRGTPAPFVHSFDGGFCPGTRARVFWDYPNRRRRLRWFKPWPTFTITGDDDE